MRFLIYGAGAVGGVIGGRLFQAGHDVTLIARGAHGEALRERGLELIAGESVATLPIPTVGHPSELELTSGDVVVLAMKTQDTAPALAALAADAPPDIRIVCAQNGVENERLALRRFEHVYAMVVMCPSSHLQPGQVVAHWAPVSGLLDLGCYPSGVDGGAVEIAAALAGATFGSEPRPDILRWKYRKLLMNLANAAIALCGRGGLRPLVELLQAEGEACLRAAGIEATTVDEDSARRGELTLGSTSHGSRAHADSSSQSLARQLGSIETDYLNGEIVLLGRLHGVATPANAVVQRLANEAATARRPPGGLVVDAVLAEIAGIAG
ncbi:MAG: ketopantoate reductase family protein [Acidimicrobiales bacterium]